MNGDAITAQRTAMASAVATKVCTAAVESRRAHTRVILVTV